MDMISLLLNTLQKIALGIGLLLLVATCLYVPWAVRECETRSARGSPRGDETWDHWSDRLDRGNVCSPLDETPYNAYGWTFRRPYKAVRDGGDQLITKANLNVELLLTEWLGISMFTGAFIWLLQQKQRKD